MSPGWPDRSVDVAVVGAGPAGMAAAAAAASTGCTVTVLDANAAPGGQYHRQPAAGQAAAAATSVGRFDRLVAGGAVGVRSATTVWTAEVGSGEPPFRLHLAGVGRPLAGDPVLDARSVVLATGAIDRVLPFPGWDLPGVLTAGGAQTLLKAHGLLPGRRVVVGGSGPFLLPVAAGVAEAGAEVLGVVEATGVAAWPRHARTGWHHRHKLAQGLGYLRTLRRHHVPVGLRRGVVRAEGDGRVEQVTTAELERDWTPVPGTAKILPADAACVSFGFVPQVGLAALLGCRLGVDEAWGDQVAECDDIQATTTSGVFAAGEVTGVSGAEGASAEGAVAGLSAAASLGRLSTRDLVDATRVPRLRRERERAFARALGRLFGVRAGWTSWLEDTTLICRCEEVDYASVREAVVALGASDLRSVKLTTRCGMGFCQARMCGEAVGAIVADLTGGPPPDAGALSTPPLLAPVPLSRLAEGASRGGVDKG